MNLHPQNAETKENMKALDKLILLDDEGNGYEVAKADYVKHILKENAIKPYKDNAAEYEPKQIVDHIIKAVSIGKDVDEAIQSDYAPLVETIKTDVERTMNSKQSAKEKAASEKEAKDKAKAEEAAKAEAAKAALAKTQQSFVAELASGASAAAEEFKVELENLAASMPEGVRVVQKDGGYGIEVDDGATPEQVGSALGYLMQKESNSTFIGNQLHFWIGDVVRHTVAKGVFGTAKEASQSISKLLEEKHGKFLNPGNIDAYKRMSERTPIGMRNPKADPTAYLAISSLKVPKKQDKETDEAYKARINKYEADREELQRKLASGEKLRRKDILDDVNEVAYKYGLKERPDENKGPSTGQWHTVFFQAKFALEELADVHEEGFIVYKKDDKLVKIPVAEMEEKYEEAKANLANVYFTNKKAGVEPRDFKVGYKEVEVTVEFGKDSEGKPIKDKQKTKNYIYPEPFWQVEEEKKKEEEKETANA